MVAESTAAGFRVIEPGDVGRRAPSHQLEVLRVYAADRMSLEWM